MDLVGEIKKLPNLGYHYYKDDGRACVVVLGGNSCPVSENYSAWQSIIHHNDELCRLFEMKPYPEDVKNAIAYHMKKMRSACDTRMSGTYTPAQQVAYIDALSAEERKQIEDQVLMYKEAYAIYLDSLRGR